MSLYFSALRTTSTDRSAIWDGLYLYLYNYELDRWPTGNPELGYLDCDGGATKTHILNLRREGKDSLYWDLSFGKRKVHEELYHIAEDPY
jgi:N-sulfoglucosamine sulfohydrolase